MKIAIIYLGAYNTFDFCYSTHKKNMFNILEKENIDYDVYVSVANEIVLKDPNKEKLNFILDKFKYYLEKHIPDNIDIIMSSEHPIARWWNIFCDKITSKTNYTEEQFRLIFEDKIKYLNTENNLNKLNKKVALLENLHYPLDFYESTFFKRVELIDSKIKDNYDLYLYLRPDIIINSPLNLIKYFVTLNEEEKNKFLYCNQRLDWFFCSKYKLGYLLNIYKEEILQRSLKLNQMELIFKEVVNEKEYNIFMYNINRLDADFIHLNLKSNPEKILEL